MDELIRSTFGISQFLLIVLSVAILARCLRSMLRERYESETWAYIRLGRDNLPVQHWENILGRSRSADVRIQRKKVARVHAVLTRSDKDIWTVYDVFGKRGVWVNGRKIGPEGAELEDGDTINLGGNRMRFLRIGEEDRRRLERKRTRPGKVIAPFGTLLELTVFQILLLLQHCLTAEEQYLPSIALAYATLALLEWAVYMMMRLVDRTGFEIELLAFYLTTLGLEVAVTSTPEDMFKQVMLMVASVAAFLLLGAWLRNLERATMQRKAAGVLTLALLAVNVLASDEVFGARNWIYLGGYSFQPSELVKVFYLYVGASTLDRLYRKRNLVTFIAFSAVCVIALALIGDFGTALVFFACFLVISFMRSGSIATVLLAVAGAGMAGVMAVSIKPYIARRFATWGHVWEDIYDAGYQQTRAMSAAASGGLLGKGAGAGWLKGIVAANTDMVFAVICEELGLIIAVCMVLAVLALALFALRSARHGRTAYFAIASCGAMTMLMVQLGLNVFGSLDILPFTGVTFPFVSRGGSSLLSCWMLMAFLKGADNRRDASFVVRPAEADLPPLDGGEEGFDEDEEDGV